VDVSYIISDILDMRMTTYAEMTFKCHSRSSNVVLIESSYIWVAITVYNNFRGITHRFRDTSWAVLMLKTTFLPTPLVFDVEFEGHAVGVWRRNLAQKTKIMGLPYGREMMIVDWTVWARCTSVTDGQIIMIKTTALYVASRGKNSQLSANFIMLCPTMT